MPQTMQELIRQYLDAEIEKGIRICRKDEPLIYRKLM